jgi:hypothetical protein
MRLKSIFISTNLLSTLLNDVRSPLRAGTDAGTLKNAKVTYKSHGLFAEKTEKAPSLWYSMYFLYYHHHFTNF